MSASKELGFLQSFDCRLFQPNVDIEERDDEVGCEFGVSGNLGVCWDGLLIVEQSKVGTKESLKVVRQRPMVVVDFDTGPLRSD